MMKLLILIRHAHRDISEHESDNGLSEKGLKQALLLAEYWKKQLNEKLVVLLSSPKKRCRETLAPLAKALEAKVKICKDLDEQLSTEGSTKFNKRIQTFLKDWEGSEDLITIACSHGDWIPQAIAMATGENVSLKKGAFAMISIRAPADEDEKSSKPKLVSVVQELG